jgi:hypothetical protein
MPKAPNQSKTVRTLARKRRSKADEHKGMAIYSGSRDQAIRLPSHQAKLVNLSKGEQLH